MSKQLDLYSMSLTELLAVEVTTVSKKAEPLVSAPGIITVISKEEIQSFGGRHIKDVLQRLPNLYIFDSPTFVATGVNLRSGATQHLNNRVLYLINGRPLREAQNGGLHTDIHLLMPIELLERIEMIRGPGSVLYGSNAFNGTINFITHSNSKQASNVEASAFVSTEQHSGASVTLAKSFSDKGSFVLSLNGVDDEGNSHQYIDEGQRLGSKQSYIEGYSLNLHGAYDGWTINAMANQLDIPIVSGAFNWPSLTNWQFTRRYLDVGYEFDINDSWTGAFNTTYNFSDRDIDAGIRTATYYQSATTLVDGLLTGSISESLNIVAGFSYEWLKGELSRFGGAYETTRSSMFGQMDYLISDQSKLTVGAQWNNFEKEMSNISPRLALHHQFNSSWSSKLLYSEAFRTAYGSELFFDAVFLQGDKQLSPELIKTVEWQTTYNDSSFFASLTLFNSETTDSIGRALIDGSVTFVNQEIEIDSKGLEAEFGLELSKNWRVNGSLSVQDSSDSEGHDNVTYGTDDMAKLGIRYIGDKKYQLGIWYSYFGAANKLESNNPNVLVYNPPASAFGLLSANFRSNLGELFNKPSLLNTTISLFINNVANENVYYPDLSRKRVNSIQQDHHRSSHLKLTVTF